MKSYSAINIQLVLQPRQSTQRPKLINWLTKNKSRRSGCCISSFLICGFCGFFVQMNVLHLLYNGLGLCAPRAPAHSRFIQKSPCSQFQSYVCLDIVMTSQLTEYQFSLYLFELKGKKPLSLSVFVCPFEERKANKTRCAPFFWHPVTLDVCVCV